jgi:hypothetical protein
MTRCISLSVLSSEFDNFLFAPIGDNHNDMPLSVLSVLARLNIDPWKEAAELAQLPREMATQRLASSIASLPDISSVHLEHETIASRLIALLPYQASSSLPLCRPLAATNQVTQFRSCIWTVAFFLILTLAAQWFIGSSQTSTPVDNSNVRTASKASLQLPPLDTGQ